MAEADSKQYLLLQVFELAYLVVLAGLPFVLVQYFVATIIISLCVIWAMTVLLKRLTVLNIHIAKQTVLITGCDSGFGNALARRLEAMGFVVIAGCKSLESEGVSKLKNTQNGHLSVVQLDVTDPGSVNKCLEYTTRICGDKGLWALVNNAGVHVFGDIEFSTMDMYKQVAEVNLFGLIRMTKTFLPLLKKAQGRVVNVSGTNALIGVPGESVTAVTKSGVEIFSEVLQMEMKRFGVDVVVVEPGHFGATTGMLSQTGLAKFRQDYDQMWEEASEETRQAYGRQYLETDYQRLLELKASSCASMRPVVDALETAIVRRKPAATYMVDGTNSLIDPLSWLARLKPFLPACLLQILVQNITKTQPPTSAEPPALN